MNIQAQLQEHFRAALTAVTENRVATDELAELLTMIRPSQDSKFGDYQANCAMPLGKQLARPPREIAAALVEQLVAHPGLLEMCSPPETAGPGFINLRLRDEWLSRQLAKAFADPRLGIEPVASPQTYLVDFSSPNVAKPMHVGHVRSTVIGDALYRVLKFLGHRAIGDNHLGDWGTQFGMIIYGWKHFRDEAAFQADAVAELSRLYRLVSRLVNHEEGRQQLPKLFDRLVEQEAARRQARIEIYENEKKRDKALRQLQRACDETSGEIAALEQSLAATDRDPQLATAVAEHPDVGAKVLEETAKLHSGDPENLALWKRFLPPCVADIDRIYRRLGVSFDETLGESFYHSMLAGVVQNLLESKIARRSEGAVGVFFDDQPGRPPLLIQKQDGAFLYATTDLATIQYRLERWQPDAILYVVDHRQSLHFEQLFKTARQWLGLEKVELVHVSFGTVLGDDGRPFKTRSGDTVGLWGLLDEAVARALAVVSANDDAKSSGAELSPEQRQKVAEAVGIGAIKYADLSQNRTSDYVFSYDKMLAMTGNTAAYMQYAHARVSSIFARGEVALSDSTTGAMTFGAGARISIANPAERALALEILRFEESLATVVSDYRPNHLTTYLFTLAGRFSTFYEQCPVLKAETPELQCSRLALCDVTARTLRQGLALLGIDAVDKM